MCGITGFVELAGHAPAAAEARVATMARTLAHRGPDGEGTWADDLAAFGHRRLSIIDVAAGRQPMGTPDGRVQVCFNGEIYNFMEVRRELQALGHAFRTQSDTEVILQAYLQWGEASVARLNGMFAYALWDARARRLLVARDRVGEKPLFYRQQGSGLAFASELKALRAGGFCGDAVDDEALDCYLSLGYVPAPRCLWRGVRKLRAAHYLVFSESGLVEKPYWKLKIGVPRPRSLDEAVEEFEPLLDAAVKARLMSEVPLGAFLSGGLDSSLVVSSMAKAMGRPVVTNSIGSQDARYDELDQARAVAQHLGTEHHEHVVVPQAVQVLERIAWHLDEPIADSSAVPTWYVCEMARRTVTVALTGDGGDESFGGYTFRYAPHVMESRLRAALPVALRAPVFGALGAAWPASAKLPRPLRLRTIFRNLAVGDSQAYYEDLTWLKSDVRQRLYSRAYLEDLKGFTPFEVVEPHYSDPASADALARSQYADLQVYMTDDVFVKVDRMSMAHALETRAPLVDPSILEFAATLPAELKLGPEGGKRVLRRLAEKRLPAAVVGAKKKGFSIPADEWLRGELKDYAWAHIFGRDGLVRERLNPMAAQRLWAQHQSGARNHGVILWGLMMLGLWEAKR